MTPSMGITPRMRSRMTARARSRSRSGTAGSKSSRRMPAGLLPFSSRLRNSSPPEVLARAPRRRSRKC